MEKGLIVEIYESKSIGNCSNNGISANFKKALLIGENIPGVFEADGLPVVKIENHCTFDGVKYYRAVEVINGIAAHIKKGARCMMGGAFIYCSDSRFPNPQPVALHDRYEY